ncbi:MAG: fluoride efflux transporter CrcB [Clostridiales bacterium]|jgi:CrcB protein|nr:fluoride efflux transporter CrcB [Clostridiales bacterium]
MLNCLVVGIGGFIGAVSRYLLGTAFGLLNLSFPVGTLLINVIGAVIIGAFSGFSANHTGLHDGWRLFIQIGICGGFTTFSTFTLETFELFQNGRTAAGFIYITASVAICLLGVLLGGLLGRTLHHLPLFSFLKMTDGPR